MSLLCWAGCRSRALVDAVETVVGVEAVVGEDIQSGRLVRCRCPRGKGAQRGRSQRGRGRRVEDVQRGARLVQRPALHERGARCSRF
eukprot:3554424-Pyramimonas_sp.AAC.1